MIISETIKAIRNELKMSQTDFAEAVHVSFSTVNRWENNKVIPNRMARALIIDFCEKNGVSELLIKALKEYK
ncbi:MULTISPECIES: helix-turn-helix domain-containing protein [Bacillota]|jgi:DNA-binding transcriptional regulator YiaG|uniref:Helix-turn-helix protein n=2 Tax=Clostridia TaxID=186801 RepID=A0A4R6Q6H5_9FIRM|nr:MULTISPECIES: helix-turn-helix transcriptional regulator [Clostridia]MBP9037459.1 helix-turn-helix transcriptional regulator [Candidatus Cloacimonas sp.]RXE60535.1 XRE family transcriptional regulator [Acetivibrio mesophilus]TDP57667.1 helix-turn-helix protein [Aminicella lysinilytica]